MEFNPEGRESLSALEKAKMLSYKRRTAAHSHIEDMIAIPITVAFIATIAGLSFSGATVPATLAIGVVGPYFSAKVYKALKSYLSHSADEQVRRLSI